MLCIIGSISFSGKRTKVGIQINNRKHHKADGLTSG